MRSKGADEMVEEKSKMKKSSAVGNAAAMREALEKVRFYLPYFLQYMRLHWEDAEAGGYYERILEVVNASLSAPARNCDLYNNAETARQAWLDDADNWDEFGSPRLELCEWLFASAKKNGENDGIK